MQSFIRAAAILIVTLTAFPALGADAGMPESFKRNLAAAEKGDAKAMLAVCEAYRYGKGTQTNIDEAAKWARSAADKGELRAMYHLGEFYQMGGGVARDVKKAMEWYRRAAEGGESSSMAGIGWLYYHGMGVERDIKTAIEWYRKSAEAGSPEGMNNLGHIYRMGEGLERDAKKAIAWFTRSAELGNVFAMDNLGAMISEGDGTARDFPAARRWLEKAAAEKYPPAMSRLAELYLGSQEHPVDYALALKWAKASAEAGSTHAMRLVGLIHIKGYGIKEDYAQALKWYEKAYDAGDPEATADVVAFYLQGGPGLEAQPGKAVPVLEKLAAAGNPGAMRLLAKLYSDGVGVAKDPATAEKWTRRADRAEAAPVPAAADARSPIAFTAPATWKPLPPAIMLAKFEAQSDGGKVVISVVVLPMKRDQLAANINRWRAQLRLEALEETALMKSLKEMKVDQKPGYLVDIEGAGENAQRTVGVIVQLQDNAAFFKLTGPSKAVAAQKAAFEKFMETVKFVQ